jgi:hypothetical protein
MKLERLSFDVIFNIFETPAIDRDITARVDGMTYCGGDYDALIIGQETLMWHGDKLIAICANEIQGKSRFNQLCRLTEETTARTIHKPTPGSLNEHFENWRVSCFENGDTQCEIYEKPGYATWLFEPGGRVLSFHIHNWEIIATKERPSQKAIPKYSSENMVSAGSFLDLLNRRILPWLANRFPEAERSLGRQYNVVSFREGSYTETTAEVFLESVPSSANLTLPPLFPPPTA